MIKSKRLKWAGHIASMEEDKSAFKILTATPAGKRALGRPTHRWEDNIKINTRNSVDSAQDRDHCKTLVNAALNLRAP